MKLDELRRQLTALQRFSQEGPGQARELLPGLVEGLDRSMEELQAIVAGPPGNGQVGTGGAARSTGKRSREARLGSGLRFDAWVERGPVLVRIVGADGRCKWVNQAWLDFTGRSTRQLLGKGWLEDVHAEDRSRCAAAYQEAFDPRELFRVEYRLRHANGEYGWVLEIGMLRSTSRGSRDGYVGTAIDITERKQVEMNAEQELRLHRERMRSLMADLLLGEEHERRRLAIDLHDGLSQTIALVQMKLSALRAGTGGKLDEALGEIERLIDQTDRSARSISFELSPPVLHDLGLEAAMKWLVENIQARYGIEILLEDDGRAKPADERTRTILFRSVRELLINAAKHARASRVHVRLECVEDRFKAAVEDDGVGMEPDVAAASGCGLFSIHERLSHVGGSMHIESAPGRGTKIRLCAPLAKDKQAKAMVKS